MRNLISAIVRHMPKEFRHLKFTDVVVADSSITLVGRNAEINLLRDENLDRIVMDFLLQSV